MRALSKIGKSTLIVRLNWLHEPGQQRRIDVWWGGLENNGDMMLLLAHLLQLNPEWRDARIVVRSIGRNEEELESKERSLAALLQEVRIQAETGLIRKPEDRSIPEVIRDHSAGASLVFLGMQDPSPGSEDDYARRLNNLSEGLSTTVFVRNAGEFAGKLI